MTKKHASFVAAILTTALLTGCSALATPDSESSPQEPPAATEHEQGTPEPQVEENPALNDAVKDWQPLSEYEIVRYDKATKNFTSAQISSMSHRINRFAWGMSVRKQSLQAKDTKSLEDDVIRWLPTVVREPAEEAFTRTEQGVYPSEIRVLTNRLPDGAVLQEDSVYTQAWHAEEFRHDDGTPGVKLTLFWRIVYRYEDAVGITRALPVARWATFSTSNNPEARLHSDYDVELGVSTPYDTCALHVDGVLTTGQELKDIDVEGSETLTTPHDKYVAFEDWGDGAPTSLTEDELTEVATACEPTGT